MFLAQIKSLVMLITMEMVESAHQDLVFNRFRKQKELSAANGFNPKLNRAKTDYNQICGLRASHRAGPCKHW